MTNQSIIREAFVHHSENGDAAKVDTLAEMKNRVQAIQNFHMDGRGWSDIAYHFVVFQPDENHDHAVVFQGRRTVFVPSAQLNHNSNTLAICVYGNGQADEMQRNTRFVVEDLIRMYPDVERVGGHRDVVATQCPGDKFYRAVPRIADALNLKHF